MPADPGPEVGLAGLQRRMQAAVLGLDAPDAEPLLTTRLGLALYRSSYRMRLLECMRSLHPALVRLLGEELFDGFAQEYLDRHPPADHRLNRLDRHFAEDLQQHRPDRGTSHPEPWIDLMIDLVRLECRYTEVLDGPGLEDSPAPPALPDRPPPGWRTATAPGAPCLRLLAVGAPVHHYLLAAHRGEPAEPPPHRPTWLALTRRQYTVVIRELDEPQYAALSALRRGLPLAAALGDHAPQPGWSWLGDWLASGFLTPSHRLARLALPALERTSSP
jgi:hypothetical protein